MYSEYDTVSGSAGDHEDQCITLQKETELTKLFSLYYAETMKLCNVVASE